MATLTSVQMRSQQPEQVSLGKRQLWEGALKEQRGGQWGWVSMPLTSLRATCSSRANVQAEH